MTRRFASEEYRHASEVAIRKSDYQAIKPMFIRDVGLHSLTSTDIGCTIFDAIRYRHGGHL